MTTPHTPMLPLAGVDDDLLTEADDLLSSQRMGQRARLLLARSARMQSLHGQALQAARSQPGMQPPALAPTGASVQDALAQSAAYAVVTTHHQRAAAATQAHQWAAADPLMARLQAAIDGRPAAPQVVDVQATELPRSRPDTGDTSGITNITNITDVADATGAGRTNQPGQAPTPAA